MRSQRMEMELKTRNEKPAKLKAFNVNAKRFAAVIRVQQNSKKCGRLTEKKTTRACAWVRACLLAISLSHSLPVSLKHVGRALGRCSCSCSCKVQGQRRNITLD